MSTWRVSHSNGSWKLKRSGTTYDVFNTKSQAVQQAKRLAKDENEKSKVVIEKMSGTTQDTVTYEPSGRSRGSIDFGF